MSGVSAPTRTLAPRAMSCLRVEDLFPMNDAAWLDMLRRESHAVYTFQCARTGETRYDVDSARAIAMRMLDCRDPRLCREFVDFERAELRCCTMCAVLYASDPHRQLDCVLRVALVVSEANHCIERARECDVCDIPARHMKMISAAAADAEIH